MTTRTTYHQYYFVFHSPAIHYSGKCVLDQQQPGQYFKHRYPIPIRCGQPWSTPAFHSAGLAISPFPAIMKQSLVHILKQSSHYFKHQSLIHTVIPNTSHQPKHPLYQHGSVWLAMMNTEIYIGTHWQWLVRKRNIHTLFQERMDVCPW